MPETIHRLTPTNPRTQSSKEVLKANLHPLLPAILRPGSLSQKICILIISHITYQSQLLLLAVLHIQRIGLGRDVGLGGFEQTDIQLRIIILQQQIQLHLSLHELLLIRKLHLFGLLHHLLLGVDIDLLHELGGRVGGPILLLEQPFLHAFAVSLLLDLLVTAEDLLLEMSGREHNEERVYASDDQGCYVDRVHVFLVEDDGEEEVS